MIAGQSWHWVDPAAGAVKAGGVLHPNGRLVVFGHVFEPPEPIAAAFAAAYREVVPDSPFGAQPAERALDGYQKMYRGIGAAARETGEFDEPEHWRFDWRQAYTTLAIAATRT